MSLVMLIKDLNIRSLVSGDKSARIVLETTDPRDVVRLAKLADKVEIVVGFFDNGDEKR